MSRARTVLLVDDEPTFLALASERLDGQLGLRVVGTADGGAAALELARQLRPDVAVLDVLMPGLSGYDTARRFTAELPGTLVVLTSSDDGLYDPASARAVGAVAFLGKKRLVAEALVDALAAAVS